MWQLSNRTRFAAARTFARDRDGAEVLLVVVKATYEIGEDGRLRIAEKQLPVVTTPVHAGDPTRSSLRHDCDVALVKRATDVLLVGHAHASGGQPAIAVEARLRIGAWQKRVVVFGDRRWEHGLSGWTLTEPEPFVKMPLVYERAFGGLDDSGGDVDVCAGNPVGIGFAPPARETAGRAAPNLEDPSDLMRAPTHRPRPMSFGPIAREWPLRRALAGTYDERWRRERRPLVPEDFDDAFWQSAPPDQRVRIDGGEEVELTGVSPRGVLRFELPRPSLSFRSHVAGKRVEHASALHAVLFEPDRDLVSLVFQSALPCHHDLYALERTVVSEVTAAA